MSEVKLWLADRLIRVRPRTALALGCATLTLALGATYGPTRTAEYDAVKIVGGTLEAAGEGIRDPVCMLRDTNDDWTHEQLMQCEDINEPSRLPRVTRMIACRKSSDIEWVCPRGRDPDFATVDDTGAGSWHVVELAEGWTNKDSSIIGDGNTARLSHGPAIDNFAIYGKYARNSGAVEQVWYTLSPAA